MRPIKMFGILICIFMIITFVTVDSAQTQALEVTQNGKVKINTIVHFKPQNSPPPNPSAGDIYFTATNELVIYANSKWNPLLAVMGTHGSQHFTSGSGTWIVPVGIYSVRVTMVGGGGGGGDGRCRRQFDGFCESPQPGGNGGNGGVRIQAILDVVPGQQINYSVGSGGAKAQNGGHSSFGILVATGGTGGQSFTGVNGSAGVPQEGSYPYGSQYGKGGQGGSVPNSVFTISGKPGISGAIFIQY